MSGASVGVGGPDTVGGVAERLYYDSPELKFQARVADIRLVAVERGASGAKEQVWQVSLDRTAFYPESGGQPWDTGVLRATARSGAVLEVPVERVEEDEATGEVWHFVRKPLVEGTEVEGEVDAERRMDHQQQHSGQHLLSAVFLAKLGARTVGFHLSPLRTGAEVSTIDLALQDGMAGLSAEEIAAVEDEVNRVVFEDRALTPRWYTREEAEAMLAAGQLRKLPERTGPMRVVAMEGVELNACGGTHVGSTGAIGSVMVRRLEKVRAGWRVEFVCGLRAVRMARREFGALSEVAGALSVGVGDVPGRVVALQEESKRQGKERQALLRELAAAEANWLHSTESEGALIEALYKKKTSEFAMALAAALRGKGRGAVIGFEEEESGGVVFQRRPGSALNAGQVVKELLQGQDRARGGGSPELAQVLCDRGSVASLRERLAQIAKEQG